MKPFRSTGVVMVAVAISAVFGLIRETVIAAEFGTSADSDAFFFAFQLIGRFPELLSAAVAGALIPVYMRTKDEPGGEDFVSTAINAYVLLLAIVAAVTAVAAPLIVSVFGAGFDDTVGSTAVLVIRILSPGTVLIGLWGILKTLLHAEGRFFVSVISQAFLSVGVILATVLFAATLGIKAVPIGVIAAAVAQVSWAAFWVRRSNLGYRLTLNLANPAFRRFVRLLRPALLGAVMLWAVPAIHKLVASYLSEGTISALSFANRPVTILQRLTVDAFIVTILPAFTWSAVNEGLAGLKSSVERTIGVVLFLLTPVVLIVAVLRRPIIQVLFERGAFDANSTSITADMLGTYVLGLIPLALAVTISAVFKSLEDTRTPAYYGAGSNLVATAVLSPVLAILFGGVGLALSASLMHLVTAAVLLRLLSRRVDVNTAAMGRAFVRTLVMSLLSVVPVVVLIEGASLAPPVLVAVGAVAGIAMYLVLVALRRSPEAGALWAQLRISRGDESGITADQSSDRESS